MRNQGVGAVAALPSWAARLAGGAFALLVGGVLVGAAADAFAADGGGVT